MNLPFSGEELAAFVAMIGSVAAAYGDLRARVTAQKEAHKERHDTLAERINTLADEVAELKEGRLAVALLEQAVASLDNMAKSMNAEAHATRVSVEHMGRSLIRIETKMGMESAPVRDAQ